MLINTRKKINRKLKKKGKNIKINRKIIGKENNKVGQRIKDDQDENC